jgi:hypothetical protein
MPRPHFRLAILAAMTPLALTMAAATPAFAQSAPQSTGFVRVSDAGESRVDAVRDGVHEGVPVRFLDMTIRNTSGQTTFPETIQKVWWQGRENGRSVDARHRDLRQRGMYEYVAPGAVWEVTYIIPRREDVLGVTISDPAQRSTEEERLRTWDELRGGPATTPPQDDAVTQVQRAVKSVPAPVKRKLAPVGSRLKGAVEARLPGFLR